MRFLAQWTFTVQNLPMESHAVRIAFFRQRSSSRLLPFQEKRPPEWRAPATMPCPFPAMSHREDHLPLAHVPLPAAFCQLLIQPTV